MKQSRSKGPKKTINRRTFLGYSTMAGAAMLIPRHVLGGRGFVAPSDKVSIAVIGTGGQGLVNLRELFKEDDVEVIAIADPNEESDYSQWYYGGTAGRKPALDLIKRHQSNGKGDGVQCADYIDYRRMLEREKSIDAVLVATPDHVHAVATIAALKLGKHVYCEKPLTRTIYEARQIAAAAKAADVATQMGNQGHSGEGIRKTCEYIWAGAIGEIREVQAWTGAGGWAMDGRPKETPPVPRTFNWDLWLGPAPYRPYHPTYAPFNWRGWWDFGTAAIGDMACHNMDPAFWALKLGHPTSVEAIDTPIHPEITPESSTVRYEFPEREGLPAVTVTWFDGDRRPPRPEELGGSARMDGNGVIFIGSKGKIICPGWGGAPTILPEALAESTPEPAQTIPRSKGHHRDWLDACKGGPRSSADFEYSTRLTEFVLLGNVAQRTEGKILWDGEAMKVTNNESANQWVTPKYREGWSL